MLRVKDGDDDAFEQLVGAYQDRLIGVFTHMLGDRESAEDLAQEAFLRVYRARAGYEPTAKFSTWLYCIAHNLASNARRSKGRKKEVQFKAQAADQSAVRPAENLVPEKSAMMPTRQFDKGEMRQIVLQAMESLSERQRMALLLHKFEEMSYADIGESMDMSSAAVKSLLSRARDSLRVILEPHVK